MEVFGQRKLLKWSIPGAAHFFVFWAFVILASVYLEAYGVLLFSEDFAIPVIGHWPVLGFAQDLIAVLALVSLAVFAWIRLKNAPEKLGRKSRFKGSHLGGAWLVLFMIFNVIWTMFLFRGAASAAGNLPYDSGAFVSIAIGDTMDGLSEETLEVLEGKSVPLIELIPPVHQRVYKMGLEHLGVVVGDTFDEFVTTHKPVLTGQQFQGPHSTPDPVYVLLEDFTHVKFYRLSLRDSVELDSGSPLRDGFHHVEDWVPQQLVTATGPNPLPR